MVIKMKLNDIDYITKVRILTAIFLPQIHTFKVHDNESIIIEELDETYELSIKPYIKGSKFTELDRQKPFWFWKEMENRMFLISRSDIDSIFEMVQFYDCDSEYWRKDNEDNYIRSGIYQSKKGTLILDKRDTENIACFYIATVDDFRIFIDNKDKIYIINKVKFLKES